MGLDVMRGVLDGRGKYLEGVEGACVELVVFPSAISFFSSCFWSSSASFPLTGSLIASLGEKITGGDVRDIESGREKFTKPMALSRPPDLDVRSRSRLPRGRAAMVNGAGVLEFDIDLLDGAGLSTKLTE